MVTPVVFEIDDPGWLAFVAARPEATPFHHPEWARMLGDCFGFRAFAIGLAADDGTLHAGVPVIETRGLRARRWISLPFTDACKPLGDASLFPQLIVAVDELRRAEGVGSGEIRSAVESPLAGHARRGVVHTLRLGPDPDAVYATFDRSQVQRGIRKAERDGVVVRAGTSSADLLEVFYELHLLTRRRLGVPIQPRRFFELLWERILEPGLGFVLVAEREGYPEAAAVFLGWSRTLIYKYGASDPARRSSRPNHAIFWDAIRRGCAEGYEVLDFGRTDLEAESLRAFKSGWGTAETDLVHSTFGAASAARAGRVDGALSAVIRRSPPWVCRVLGERLYRYAA